MRDDVGSWLVTGAGGMLGCDLLTRLAEEGAKGFAATRAQVDVTDPTAVDAAFAEVKPAVVVNLAAWTDVDGAEEREADAHRVNADGAYNIARACARHGALMIHLSTDYVFDGNASRPYAEDAPRSPESAYGRTKAEGELAVLDVLPNTGVVLRTAWLYGVHGTSFIRTLCQLADEREFIDVVDDQVGQPTWTVDLAERIVVVGRSERACGVLHATSSGHTTWFGLAQAVFAERGLDPERVRPTTTDRFPRPAPRPAYSVLGHDRWAELGLSPMRPWRDALIAAMPILMERT